MKTTVVSDDLDNHALMTNQKQPSTHLAILPEMPVTLSQTISTPRQPIRSYQPYTWNVPNILLDIVDKHTNGRAGQIQRIISYLFFGGLAAIVNLLVFAIMLRLLPGDSPLQNTIAYVVAAELSIMANFIPNDRFTFNTLAGAKRPWLHRCWRFHTTCIIGTILTYLIESLLVYRVHVPALIAEAIAIIIVLIYNFSAHHLFTYRQLKHA